MDISGPLFIVGTRNAVHHTRAIILNRQSLENLNQSVAATAGIVVEHDAKQQFVFIQVGKRVCMCMSICTYTYVHPCVFVRVRAYI